MSREDSAGFEARSARTSTNVEPTVVEEPRDEASRNLETLIDQVRALTERVAELEARLDQHHPPGELSDDVVLAISAACAAYLGHRAKVRSVRLRRPSTWTTEGRAEIQHGHNLY